MEIIDAHAHIYPEKIAIKATEAIGKFYNLKMEMEKGTSELLIEEGKSAGVSRFLVHSCATKKEQVRNINEFILEEKTKHSEFIGFMTLHQDLTEEETFNEVKWCKENGFYGIKLHPDFQKFNIDDENVYKIYRTAEKFNFPILFHTGDDRYTYSKPYRLQNICKMFNKVNFIGAHFGGYRCWKETDVYLGLDNIYFDTSSSLSFIDKDTANNLIKKFGVERFFFGTDFPMWSAKEEIEKVNKLSLTDKEREGIFANNLKALIGIK